MSEANRKSLWERWSSTILFIAATPLMLNAAEIAARDFYGWKRDYVSGDLVVLPIMLGTFLILCLRLLRDWSNGALRLSRHGPMMVVTVATAVYVAITLYDLVRGAETPLVATAFFLGVMVTCIVLMVMSPDER